MLRVTLVPCVVALIASLVPIVAAAQSGCTSPQLSEQQIRDIVARERAAGKNLPPPFPEQTTVLQRQRCHYVYIEYPTPRVPDKLNVFRLNQQGIIVDTEPTQMDCPKRVFTDSELADIVARARATHKDLPPPPPNSTAHVTRTRCLYLYFEYPPSAKPGDFQVFTIDPLGEFMDFMRNKP